MILFFIKRLFGCVRLPCSALWMVPRGYRCILIPGGREKRPSGRASCRKVLPPRASVQSSLAKLRVAKSSCEALVRRGSSWLCLRGSLLSVKLSTYLTSLQSEGLLGWSTRDEALPTCCRCGLCTSRLALSASAARGRCCTSHTELLFKTQWVTASWRHCAQCHNCFCSPKWHSVFRKGRVHVASSRHHLEVYTLW